MKLTKDTEKKFKKVLTGLKLWHGLNGSRSGQEVVDDCVWYCSPEQYDRIRWQRVKADPRWTVDNVAELVNKFLVSLIEPEKTGKKVTDDI